MFANVDCHALLLFYFILRTRCVGVFILFISFIFTSLFFLFMFCCVRCFVFELRRNYLVRFVVTRMRKRVGICQTKKGSVFPFEFCFFLSSETLRIPRCRCGDVWPPPDHQMIQWRAEQAHLSVNRREGKTKREGELRDFSFFPFSTFYLSEPILVPQVFLLPFRHTLSVSD